MSILILLINTNPVYNIIFKIKWRFSISMLAARQSSLIILSCLQLCCCEHVLPCSPRPVPAGCHIRVPHILFQIQFLYFSKLWCTFVGWDVWTSNVAVEPISKSFYYLYFIQLFTIILFKKMNRSSYKFIVANNTILNYFSEASVYIPNFNTFQAEATWILI